MSALARTRATHRPAAAAEVQGYTDTLVEIATRYREAAVLFAALELDLFKALQAQPGQRADAVRLAAYLGLQEQPLRLLLETLAAMCLLRRTEKGCFTPVPEVAELLLVERMDEWLLSNKQQNRIWLQLDDMVRGTYESDEPFYETLLETPLIANYLRSIRQTNTTAAADTVAEIRTRLPRLFRSLDIGAGHGLFSQHVLEEYPEAFATLFDLPRSLEIGRAALSAAGLAARAEFVAGDANDLQLRGRFDLIMINDLLHYFDLQAKRRLLNQACERLQSGGLLAVCKIAYAEVNSAPTFDPAMISLRFYINTQRGYLETDRELVRLFAEAGLGEVDCIRLNNFKSLVVGRAAPTA